MDRSRVRAALVVVSTVLGFGVAEIGVRLVVPEAPNVRFVQNQEALTAWGRQSAQQVLEDHDDLFWRLVPSSTMPEDAFPMRGVIANSAGLREDHEVPLDRPAGQLRILFLGDSCTFGSGLLHDQGFVEHTERILSERLGDVEAINAGVPGYTIHQQWQWYQREGRDYEVDAVVLTSGWNEGSSWGSTGDLDQQARLPIIGLRWSRFARLVWRWGVSSEGPERPRITPDEFGWLLDEVAAAAEPAAFRAVAWPAPANIDPSRDPDARTAYQVEVYRSEYGIDLVPVARELAQEYPSEAIFMDHIHGTELANQAFAEAIADDLEPLLSR